MTIPFAALEAQNGMKPSRLGANYKFLLHCTWGIGHTTEHVEVSGHSPPLNRIIMCAGRSFKHK